MRPFVLLVIVAVLAVGLGWVLRGCGAEPAETGRAGQRSTGEAVEGLWYCPMHPQVTSPGSGTCGLCGMDLVAPSVGEDPGPRRFAMSEAAVKLAEVVTVPVERKFVTADVRLVGKVDFDETRVKTISAWVPGRLERLFVGYTGVPVQEGDHLVLLYSAELMTAQVALLEALKAVETGVREPSEFLRESDRRSLESAREKLRLWGLSQEQIEEIEERLAGLSRQDVLDAIACHLQIDDFEAIIITSEAEALQQRLEEEASSPMSYPVPQPEEVEADDREIEVLKVAPASIRIIDVEDLFQR